MELNNIEIPSETTQNKLPDRRCIRTIGIELESIGLSQTKAARVADSLPENYKNNFKVCHDASCEIKAVMIPVHSNNGNPSDDYSIFNYHTKEAMKLFGSNRAFISGYELVSVPMKLEDFESTIRLLLPKLEYAGDFVSERCATHIHIGMRSELRVIKNLLKLGLWADELFYSLSGMGGKFRGYSNNAIYARPIQNGPFFKHNGDWYQTLNYRAALQADNMYDFFCSYAIDIHKDPIKYTPGRYFSINLYSILLHGTIEFRHFNQSFDPGLVCAIAKLCQIFAEMGIMAKWSDIKDLPICDVFETKAPWYYIDKLQKLLYMAKEMGCLYELNESDIDNLEKVIRTYKGIGIRNAQVQTHIKEKELNLSDSIIEKGKLEKSRGKPIPDGHVDIHNIKYSSIFGE